jgi:hypothetical protein
METLKLDEKTLTTLGGITSNFSVLEFLLACHVSRLISDDPKIGAIITCEMSFQSLFKAFDSLIRYKITDPEQLKRSEDLVKRLKKAEEDRNKVIHSIYAFEVNAPGIMRFKATAKQGKGLRFTKEKIEGESWKDITAEQMNLITELESLYKNPHGQETIEYG